VTSRTEFRPELCEQGLEAEPPAASPTGCVASESSDKEVREGRFELPRPFGHRILSPARLPGSATLAGFADQRRCSGSARARDARECHLSDGPAPHPAAGGGTAGRCGGAPAARCHPRSARRWNHGHHASVSSVSILRRRARSGGPGTSRFDRSPRWAYVPAEPALAVRGRGEDVSSGGCPPSAR
jgi:hypothetical protein